jgi:hypothetical protein
MFSKVHLPNADDWMIGKKGLPISQHSKRLICCFIVGSFCDESKNIFVIQYNLNNYKK